MSQPYKSKRGILHSRKFFLIFLFLFLVLTPFISAVPPFVGQEGAEFFTEGYVIEYPPFQILKQNSDFEFEFHIFNISDGMPITSGISCYFHLDNSSGTNIFNASFNAPSHNFEYGTVVAGGNFSEVGYYGYVMQCNSSVLGGYVEESIEITSTGFPTNEYSFYYPFYIMILGVIIAWILFLVSYIFKDEKYSEFLAFFSSIIFLAFGLQAATGILGVHNFMTNTIAVVHMGIGIWIAVSSALDMINSNIARTSDIY